MAPPTRLDHTANRRPPLGVRVETKALTLEDLVEALKRKLQMELQAETQSPSPR